VLDSLGNNQQPLAVNSGKTEGRGRKKSGKNGEIGLIDDTKVSTL
jgi:hypothetical protein